MSKLRFISLKSLQILLPAVFFTAILALGLAIHRDFGLHWDAWAQMLIGKYNFDYVFHTSTLLINYKNRFYGPAFDMVLYALTRNLVGNEMFSARGLGVFLYFYVGVFFFYKLTQKITGRWQLGLLASLLLVLSPRIFADSFYNAKDIPFLVTYILAIYTMILFLERRTIALTVLHALVSAFLIAIRIPGLLVPALTVALVLLDPNPADHPQPKYKAPLLLVLYGILTVGLTVAFWPILWQGPVRQFINALAQAGDFPWSGGVVFYRGKLIDANRLPWHYIPVWIAITTPILYLLTAAIGAGKGLVEFIRQPGRLSSPAKRNFIILACWLILPWLVVVATRATLYDGWRHMFFVYPALLIFAIEGIQALWSLRLPRLPRPVVKGIVLLAVIAGILDPLVFMIRYHPYDNVYFNRLAAPDMQEVKRKYELDYWGLSYRKGLEYVLANDPSSSIPIYVENQPGEINALILPDAQKKRLHYVSDPQKARYFLTNYRWHPEPYPYPDEVFSVMVGDASILSVFRLNN